MTLSRRRGDDDTLYDSDRNNDDGLGVGDGGGGGGGATFDPSSSESANSTTTSSSTKRHDVNVLVGQLTSTLNELFNLVQSSSFPKFGTTVFSLLISIIISTNLIIAAPYANARDIMYIDAINPTTTTTTTVVPDPTTTTSTISIAAADADAATTAPTTRPVATAAMTSSSSIAATATTADITTRNALPTIISPTLQRNTRQPSTHIMDLANIITTETDNRVASKQLKQQQQIIKQLEDQINAIEKNCKTEVLIVTSDQIASSTVNSPKQLATIRSKI